MPYYIVLNVCISKEIVRRVKKQENMTHTEEKKHSIESVSEEAKTLDLLDKDLKSALLNISKSQWKPSLKY